MARVLFLESLFGNKSEPVIYTDTACLYLSSAPFVCLFVSYTVPAIYNHTLSLSLYIYIYIYIYEFLISFVSHCGPSVLRHFWFNFEVCFKGKLSHKWWPVPFKRLFWKQMGNCHTMSSLSVAYCLSFTSVVLIGRSCLSSLSVVVGGQATEQDSWRSDEIWEP